MNIMFVRARSTKTLMIQIEDSVFAPKHRIFCNCIEVLRLRFMKSNTVNIFVFVRLHKKLINLETSRDVLNFYTRREKYRIRTYFFRFTSNLAVYNLYFLDLTILG